MLWGRFLAHCGTPAAQQVATMDDPIAALAKSVGRRRASTLRQRYKAIQVMSKWFVRTSGEPTIGQIDDIRVYFHTMLKNRVGGRCLARVWEPSRCSCTWVDTRRMNASMPSRWSRKRSTAWRYHYRLGRSRREKAPSWIIIVVTALELYVISKRAEYLRSVAATKF